MQRRIPKSTAHFQFGLISDLPLPLKIPVFANRVSCGFPSPADEYVEDLIDIRDYLIKNELSTFYVRASGNSMTDAMIGEGALLIIDRSLDYRSSSKFLCFYDGDFTVKYVIKREGKVFLVPGNSVLKEIEVEDGRDFEIWGTVTYSINSHFKW